MSASGIKSVIAVVAHAIWQVIAVISAFIWRAFGLYLMVIGVGAIGGAFVSTVWQGINTMWVGAVVVAVGYMGFRIATTGRATIEDVVTAMRKAVQEIRDQQEKSK